MSRLLPTFFMFMQHEKDLFGLIGKQLSHSFSPDYFNSKFESLGIDAAYTLFDIDDLSKVTDILNRTDIRGLNVTIPYKESIIPYLDKLSKNARDIGAVNTIRKLKSGKTKGYNTDWIGFKNALQPLLKPNHESALILGTGGSSKAISFALQQMGIRFLHVSRTPNSDAICYDDLDSAIFRKFQIVINCTPLGTFPNIDNAPPLPYHYFTKAHIAFDLIYNPEETKFMRLASAAGATVSNGYQMLVNQAEKSYKIWTKDLD